MSDPFFIGLLSGTSMDAIDVALVSFEKEIPRILKTLNYPIPQKFRSQCLEIVQLGQGSIDDYGYLDAEAGELFAKAVLALLKDNSILPSQIKAIGSHGQTLRHRPNANPPYTMQIGDPNIISERTGIPTIADFRRRDMAAGGQGAPLAPGFHAAVFGSSYENRVVVNIGGISNITVLPKEMDLPLIGFDAGPGNCLMDSWVKQQWSHPFDRNGSYASQGTVIDPLLELCLEDEYFKRKPPKSTGREYFNLLWFEKKITLFSAAMKSAEQKLEEQAKELSKEKPEKQLSPYDIQATLSALTSKTIAEAIRNNAALDSAIYICGGGAHNRYLVNGLAQELGREIHSTDKLGFPPDWIEAVLFAWLAKQTLEGKSGNCPNATGARHAIPLGGIFGYCP